MMNPDLKAKWVSALRSGEYKQAKGILHSKLANAYCCLGVLCEVAGIPINDSGCWPTGYGNYEPIREAMGLGSVIFGDGSNDPGAVLVQMNDQLSKSFDEIADYVEKTL